MTAPDQKFDLSHEVEELLKTTLALTSIVNSQQQQISWMLRMFDLLLEQPDTLRDKRDLLTKMVASVRGGRAEEHKGPQLRLVDPIVTPSL